MQSDTRAVPSDPAEAAEIQTAVQTVPTPPPCLAQPLSPAPSFPVLLIPSFSLVALYLFPSLSHSSLSPALL